MFSRASRLAAFGLCTAIAGWIAFAGTRPGSAGQPTPVAALETQPPAADVERKADRDAITQAIGSFAAAFRKGDGKALAAHWSNAGEYIAEDGTTFSGRPALEKAYAEAFAKNPGHTLDVEVETIRFPSRDTAVVEGHFKLSTAKGERVVSKCSFLYAREDGKWLIAIAREWPSDGLSLRDLEWLIGNWEAKRDGTTVSTKYEWAANKSFIRCQFSITHDGQTHSGLQMIGKDPSTGLLRTWTFEDNGGIGDTDIVRDGKKFIHVGRGVMADGRVMAATNIMTPLDADSFLWHSVQRSLDDEALPDLPPIKVVRVKGK